VAVNLHLQRATYDDQEILVSGGRLVRIQFQFLSHTLVEPLAAICIMDLPAVYPLSMMDYPDLFVLLDLGRFMIMWKLINFTQSINPFFFFYNNRSTEKTPKNGINNCNYRVPTLNVFCWPLDLVHKAAEELSVLPSHKHHLLVNE